MKHATRPAIFKWRQTAPELILCAVRWYLRYSLSLRDVEELFAERGLEADHTTIWRWVQRYGAELEQRLRPQLKPTNKSWRLDETYIRVQGRWCYLYRAIDSTGATIDFLLSALRDAAAAKRLFRQALSDSSHPQPRVINTDQARLYGAAIAAVKAQGTLRCRCQHRPVQPRARKRVQWGPPMGRTRLWSPSAGRQNFPCTAYTPHTRAILDGWPSLPRCRFFLDYTGLSLEPPVGFEPTTC